MRNDKNKIISHYKKIDCDKCIGTDFMPITAGNFAEHAGGSDFRLYRFDSSDIKAYL